MAGSPRFSIGIPAYNRPEELRRALESALVQTCEDFEIIVADDASPGCDLSDIVAEIGRQDRRIRYVRHTQNIGSEANFKFVLSQARGEYFAWLADDDTVEPQFLAELGKVLDANPDVVLAMCDVNAIRPGTEERWEERLNLIRSTSAWSRTVELFFTDHKTNLFHCLYGVYRTRVLQRMPFRVGSRWKGLNTGWEVPFLAGLASRGRIVSIDLALKTYYFNDDSVYHNEIRRMRTFDRIGLRLDLLFRTSTAAMLSPLPLNRKVRYAALPWLSASQRMLKKPWVEIGGWLRSTPRNGA